MVEWLQSGNLWNEEMPNKFRHLLIKRAKYTETLENEHKQTNTRKNRYTFILEWKQNRKKSQDSQ